MSSETRRTLLELRDEMVTAPLAMKAETFTRWIQQLNRLDLLLSGEGRAQDEPRNRCSCGCSKWRHQITNLGVFSHCADCGCQRFQP